MITAIRNSYNKSFSDERYKQILADIEKDFPGLLEFRLAETPVFIDKNTKHQLLKAGEEICNFITGPLFRSKTEKAFQHVATPPKESALPECIVMDFAICKNDDNEITPQLIELQGFPSLFGFEVIHDIAFKNNFEIPKGYAPYLNGYDKSSYLQFLNSIIKGVPNKQTVLLELFPHEQKTKIDFYYTSQLINLPVVCLSELFMEDNALCYQRDGVTHTIERIYNRIVWDELSQQAPPMQAKAKLLLEHTGVEWVSHPNHFYRISKYIIPLLNSSYVPSAQYLSNIQVLPLDLENYVLKPLFSYAGQGVIIDVTPEDIHKITDPENWILQKKVMYAPIIETPTGPAKTEIRLFYFYDHATHKYIATLNLARLSKGKMIGVSYNANATWVGGSIAYFEQD
mgnify:CR=1 FL=1